ncbi:MAG: hypothetical protein ABI635_01295 [Actinomycetota bacterium]
MTDEPTKVDPTVFWEPIPAGYPESVEAELPSGERVQPELQLGGKRLGFPKPLPEGTRIYRDGRVAWIV